jgi:hypothetical protein
VVRQGGWRRKLPKKPKLLPNQTSASMLKAGHEPWSVAKCEVTEIASIVFLTIMQLQLEAT